MIVTLDGIVIDCNFLQAKNACYLINEKLSGILNDGNL